MIVDLYSNLSSWYVQDSYLHGPSKVVCKCDPFLVFWMGPGDKAIYFSGTKSQRFFSAYKVYRSASHLMQMWKQLSWSFHENDSGKIVRSSMWKKIDPELGTPHYKGQKLVPNGVRYRGVPLYHSAASTKSLLSSHVLFSHTLG